MKYKLQYNDYKQWMTYCESEKKEEVFDKIPYLKKYTNKSIRIIEVSEKVIYEELGLF